MPSSNICTDEEIARLLHAFYAKVRHDEVLGPIFNEHVADWEHHLEKLVDFWSSVLRGTGRFTGTPMPKHAVIPGLTAELFQRWLALFLETTSAQPNQSMGEQAYAMAQRIARSLWFGYQLSRNPDRLPADIPHA